MAHRCNRCQAICIGHHTSDPQPSPDTALLLATNAPPSATQKEHFLRFRVDGAKRLAELETIIGEAQQTLESAMAERDTLMGNLEHHRLVLNPVRQLPTAILRKIFLFACTRITERPFHFYETPPTFLAAVCRSWHDIAVTYPVLWRQYRFLMPSMYEGYRSMESAMMARSLSVSRSAACPLWLDIDAQTLSYSNPAYPFLLCISGRIERLRISVNDLRLLESPEFFSFASGMTTLVHLDLFIETNYAASESSGTVFLPRALQHLAITPLDAFSKPEVDFNWAHLQTLVLRRLKSTTTRSMLVILAKTCSLSRLTFFNDDYVNNSVRWQSEPVTVDSMMTISPLTDLVIEDSTPSNVYDVVAHISTPSLARLIIKGFRATLLKASPKKGTVKKPAHTRRSVTLYDVGAVDSLLRRCGVLRELSLLDVRFDTNSIIQLLSSLTLLPQLRILTIDISYVNDLSILTQEKVADDILVFLESRQNLGHAPDLDIGAGPPRVNLEVFTLHAPSKEVFDFTDVQRQRIETLRTSGLRLYVCRYAENDPRMY